MDCRSITDVPGIAGTEIRVSLGVHLGRTEIMMQAMDLDPENAVAAVALAEMFAFGLGVAQSSDLAWEPMDLSDSEASPESADGGVLVPEKCTNEDAMGSETACGGAQTRPSVYRRSSSHGWWIAGPSLTCQGLRRSTRLCSNGMAWRTSGHRASSASRSAGARGQKS